MKFFYFNNIFCTTAIRNIFFTRSFQNKPNHYEVLKLDHTCTNKEIKQAYIVLSKKYHPDLSKNTNIKRFLDISEAYNVLCKPETRKVYDLTLRPIESMKRPAYYETFTRRNPMDDPSFYRNRDRRQDYYYQHKPFYGIRGVHRMSNSAIFIACLVFMCIGVAIQVMVIRHSFTLKRDEFLIRSAAYNSSLEKLRQAADANGNKVQIAILEEKFKLNDSSYAVDE